MKTVIFAGVVLILIIMAIFFAGYYVHQKADTFEAALNDLATAIKAENWEQSMELISRTESLWKKIATQLATLHHHDELKDMSIAMASLKSYVEQEEKSDAMVQISILDFGIKHIVRKDKLYIENIF